MTGTERFALCRPQLPQGCAFGLVPFGAVLLFLVTAPAPAPAQRLPLPREEQEAVNNAIDCGVAYLKQRQQKNGTWPQQNLRPHGMHPVGYATLPALTLLECGVPGSDPIIQRAAKFLRSKAGHLDATYELALGILFLDRLGDPKDKKIIQTFALRLIAGQSATGGWGYKCPLLNLPSQKELLTALRYLDPPLEGMPVRVDGAGKKPGELTPLVRPPGAPAMAGLAMQPGTPLLSGGSVGGSRSELPSAQESVENPPDQRWLDCLGLEMLERNEPASEPDAKAESDRDVPPAKAEDKADNDKPSRRYVIPERVKLFPVIQDPALHILQDPQDKPYERFLTTTDNSNTQFAILALWTAQRHEVPMNRSLNLIVRRYVTSQNPDGTWGYHYQFGGGNYDRPQTMTCVGLIGLAVGHGLAQPRPAGQPVQDQRIINGLIALTKNIGDPVAKPRRLPMQNLYYLWSLERVAVLYNLPTIGDKDWYRWGAQVLVSNQGTEGNWSNGGYVGNSSTIDTCMALLFLKRANLVKDLTAKLPFKAAELNEDIMKILAPPASKSEELPKKTIPPVEPSKPAEPDNLLTKPPPAPDDTAKPDPAPTNTEGSKKKWIIVSLLLFVVFAGGSLFFILFALSRRKQEGSEENQDKRKDSRKKRKLQATRSEPEA